MKIRLIGDEPLLAALEGSDPSGRERERRAPRHNGGRAAAGAFASGRGSRMATAAVRRMAGAIGCSRALALRRPPPNHYAPAAVLAVHRTRIAARGLAAMGAAVLLGGVAWSGSAWNRTLDLTTATEALHRGGYRIRAPPGRGTVAGVGHRSPRRAARGRDRPTPRRCPSPRTPRLPGGERGAQGISGSAIGEPRMVRDLRP